VVILACLLGTGSAQAHGGEAWGTFGTFTYDPWVVLPLYACGLVYLLGTTRLWHRAGYGRGVQPQQVLCFWGAFVALAAALISPLHWLDERLFVAHMIEHGILIGVAAPLLVMARPTASLLWALPRSLRRLWRRPVHSPAAMRSWRLLVNPLVATLVGAAGLWIWHLPVLYTLALRSPAWHRFEHLTFTVTAMLFWWALLPRRRFGVNVFCLFVTSMQTSLLGLALTLSPKLWYSSQVAVAAEWGLEPIEDQQLAGLLMWIPMGIIYTAAALWFAALWITTAERWRPRAHASPGKAAACAMPGGR
jgi:putative membrane protein